MRGMIRTLMLGTLLAAGTATAGMAQGVNNTGYDRYGPYYGNQGYYSGNPSYNGYYRYDEPGYGYGYNRSYTPGPIEGAAGVVGGALNAAGNVAGAVLPPYGARPYSDRYGYYGDNYGYGSSYQPGWGSGGGAAYDRGYNRPYDYGYWGR